MKGVNVLLLMMGLAEYSASESGKNCTDLTITDEMSEMTLTGHCILYEDCGSDISSLPEGLSEGLSVDSPRNFEAETFVDSDYLDKDNTTYIMPGILFGWKVPASATSRNGTKGYWLVLKQVQSAVVLCRTFDLSRYSLSRSPAVSFEYRLFPLSFGLQTSFIVQLYSLPPPSEAEMNDDLYAERIVSIPAAQKKNTIMNPDQWTTWITLTRDPNRGSVSVTFGFADESFDFEKYRVRLCTAQDMKVVQETSVFQVSKKTIGEHTFEKITDGTYIVSVMPEEVYPGDPSRCVCYSREQFGRICRPCCTSMTLEFEIKATGTRYISSLPALRPGEFPSKSSGTTQEVTFMSDQNLSQSEPHPSRQSTLAPSARRSLDVSVPAEPHTPVIVGAVVGATAFVAVLLFIGWWFRRKKHTVAVRKDATSTRSLHVFDQLSAFWEEDINHVKPDLTPSGPITIQPKRVLLLAAEDHEHHIEAVERFADFLRVHCRCIVSFAPQHLLEIHEQNSYCWLSSKIDQSDYILIITSKAAYYLYLAFQKGVSYRREIFGPQGDLFTPGIQHICGMIARNAAVHHVLTVHFEYTASDYNLPIAPLPSFVYQLPKHLSSLLQHIHRLNKHGVELSKGNLPLECSVCDLLEGCLWMEAVQKAKTFEKEHPGWFEERFIKPVETTKSFQQIEDSAGICAPNSGISANSFHPGTISRPVHQALSVSLSDINRSGTDDSACHNFEITKDDFFEPSVYSAFTVLPTSDCNQKEIDDKDSFLSAQMHRLNQNYEEQLQKQSMDAPDRELAAVSQQHIPVRFSETVQNPAWGFRSMPGNHESDAIDSVTVLSIQSV